MRKLLPLLVALLCACETEPPPTSEFHILDISPREQTDAEPQVVTVRLDLEPRFFVDYGTRSARMIDQPRLRIGWQTVPLDRYLGQGQFQGSVGSGLEVGRHDVRVLLEDGREATLPGVYEVKPYLHFWIETVGDQVQGKPFTVTLRATTGPDAQPYRGSVTLTLYRGNQPLPVKPDRCGPFSDGMCQVQLTIDEPDSHYLLALADDQGRTANSNSFRVDPKN